jgi:2-C-methyl-D-erythritol 4-phosphate cytidylyltransferase
MTNPLVAERTPAFWAILAAAGVGSRMGAGRPKQYLTLAGRTVLEHSLAALLDQANIRRVVVVLAEGDSCFRPMAVSTDPRVLITLGGEQRGHSVLNGLRALEGQAKDADWVLVHDAARPCLHRTDLARLIDLAGSADFPGGLLACPVADTLKQADDRGQVIATLPRQPLWRAFTPQMFRYGELRQALTAAIDNHVMVTDEAAAMERMGCRPVLVEGRGDNIKITRQGDLALAEAILQGWRAPPAVEK